MSSLSSRSVHNHAALGLPRPRRISLLALLDLARQRRALARMDDARLQDLGLTRAEAEAEARRPFWDVPAFWRG